MKSFLVAVLLVQIAGILSLDYYDVLLYDYSSKSGENAKDIMHHNLENIHSLLETTKKLDIVVFPEYGLTSINITKENVAEFAIEVPFAEAQPYGDNFDSDYLNRLSVIAKEKIINLVVNVLEKDTKSGKYYNTNLFFSNEGQLIYRYRKINLSEWEKRFLTAGTELGIFKFPKIDIKFATLIGEDILHYNPAIDSIAERDVTNVIHTSAMQSVLPFMGSLPLFSGFAKKYGLNLLTSSYNNPRTGRGGSGMFYPEGNHFKHISTGPSTTPLLRTVRNLNVKVPEKVCDSKVNPRSLETVNGTVSRGLVGGKPSLDKYEYIADIEKNQNLYKLTKIVEGVNNVTVCTNDICCKIDVDLQKTSPTDAVYVAAAYYNKNTDLYGCGFLSCADNNLSNCGQRIDDAEKLTFKDVTISAKNKYTKINAYNIPVAMLSNYLDFDHYTYCVDETNGIVMKSDVAKDVIVYGFIGHITSGASILTSNIFLLTLIFAYLYKLF
ncbi:PREDICTED: vascular non-inflammatory molecule 3-like [Nicrophorus vespilloides]|uniref:Vascular non-inflammatory molecule 3-like n=1 Tax=Nicrophorus vespilloides TaxID=110193 RepID=A0ABM1MBL7_NICVS|nr:PREDICTED: vascular non-inflammatory molecule 3-like [Nicrophorus vespilloides]